MIVHRFDDFGRYTVRFEALEESLQWEDPERIFIGDVDMLAQRHDMTSGTPVDLPERPSKNHIFDYELLEWRDPRSIQQHRDAKWAEIKLARLNAECAGFTWDGSDFDSNPGSQARISSHVLLAMINPGFEVFWTLKDNTDRALSSAEMIQVGVALGQHIASAVTTAQARRVTIDSATTVEAIQAIVW